MKKQIVTDSYAIYNGDCIEEMAKLPDDSIHLSLYSPPFCGLYVSSSSPRDLSNCDSKEQFMEQYEFVVGEITRITMPGRMTLVHCSDVPLSNTGVDDLDDLPGDIIQLHKKLGWGYTGRYCVWKEPLGVRNRTMQKNLAHQTIVEDSSRCANASADYLLAFRRKGDNKIPIAHPNGLLDYAGERQIPNDVQSFRGWTGKQTENRYSHWIWRQYASAFWDDIRFDTTKRPSCVLPFEAGRDQEDEKHVHPLQLDIIERALVLWSNPGEIVLTPFMGVGSEVYQAVLMGRKGIGMELKESYFKQAEKNVLTALENRPAQAKMELL